MAKERARRGILGITLLPLNRLIASTILRQQQQHVKVIYRPLYCYEKLAENETWLAASTSSGNMRKEKRVRVSRVGWRWQIIEVSAEGPSGNSGYRVWTKVSSAQHSFFLFMNTSSGYSIDEGGRLSKVWWRWKIIEESAEGPSGNSGYRAWTQVSSAWLSFLLFMNTSSGNM
jgi:hypothetical protein